MIQDFKELDPELEEILEKLNATAKQLLIAEPTMTDIFMVLGVEAEEKYAKACELRTPPISEIGRRQIKQLQELGYLQDDEEDPSPTWKGLHYKELKKKYKRAQFFEYLKFLVPTIIAAVACAASVFAALK